MSVYTYDPLNYTRLLKEVLLPDWARQDNQIIKGDHIQGVSRL